MSTTPEQAYGLANMWEGIATPPCNALRSLAMQVESLTAANLEWMQHSVKSTAERDALKADAERYRWLCKSDWYVGPSNFYCSEGGTLYEYCDNNISYAHLCLRIDEEVEATP